MNIGSEQNKRKICTPNPNEINGIIRSSIHVILLLNFNKQRQIKITAKYAHKAIKL